MHPWPPSEPCGQGGAHIHPFSLPHATSNLASPGLNQRGGHGVIGSQPGRPGPSNLQADYLQLVGGVGGRSEDGSWGLAWPLPSGVLLGGPDGEQVCVPLKDSWQPNATSCHLLPPCASRGALSAVGACTQADGAISEKTLGICEVERGE